MSEKDEIKQTPESAEAPENDAASDTAAALREYAEEEAAAEAAAAAEGEEKKNKKKKPNRTPEEEKERALNSVKRRKKLKYGALATTITIVFVAIVVVINVICGLLDQRFNWNIDLTSSGLYEIDEQTINYLHQLNSDVEITMLADESYFLENSMLKVVAETMSRFQAESDGHISVEYVDPNKNPEAVSVFKQNYNGELSTGDAVVASGDLVRVVSFDDMINIEQQFDQSTYSYTTSYTFTGEQSLVSAIMGVTDLNTVTVGLIDTTGGSAIYDARDAYNYQRIQELLEKNNYEVVSVDIATAELTADYDLLMLCSPANDLTEAQVTKLTSYLTNGGQYGKMLVYFGSPFKSANTQNLDAFLALWGISVGRSYAVEKNASTAQVATVALGTLGEIPVVSVNADASLNAGYTATKLPILAPLCCPVERLFDQNSGRNTYSLLTTSESCVLYPLDETAETFDADKAAQQSSDIAVLAEQIFTSGSDTYQSRLVAFGSAWFLDYMIGASAGSYDNANYFINLMNTATGKESILTIAEKSLDQTKITITEAQARAIRTVTVFVFPLAVALVGIFVYIRRRNR